MKFHSLRKIFWSIPLLLLIACPIPDTDEYSELTREMATAVKTNAIDIINFLDEGLASDSENEIDASLLEDLQHIQGNNSVPKTMSYPETVAQNWESVFRILDALVAYSDALVSIKDAGDKESFNTLANSLNGALEAAGITPLSGAMTIVGKSVFSLIAQIRARNKLKDVIANADTVIQHIAIHVDSMLYNMTLINDVAKSQNLLKKPDSKEAQRINTLYKSLVEKAQQNRVKITLLNDYENGDTESLKFFVYQDIPSLNKLGIKDLTDQIKKTNATAGLTPQKRFGKIAALAQTTFKHAIDGKLTNPAVTATLNIHERLMQLRAQLDFIRDELSDIAPQYHKNIETQKQIEKVAETNEKLTESTRKLVKRWSSYHSQMKSVLTEKQKISFNNLRLYINEVKALKAELDALKQKK